MADFILGVAGHVDHGKTALTLAMTGVDTDRLPEEKRRGLTIEPGFAPLRLPNGCTAGLVDVPGHEKFIRNMLSGAAGLDAVLLCVAADDGVMPQTSEHLDICALLGVGCFLVAITKTDLASPERVAEVEAEIRGLPFLKAAPILPVSAKTGVGIQELILALATISETSFYTNVENKPFRLNIDRVFSKDGFGTIVTGTVTSGALSVGDEVEIYPKGVTARVRALQSHGVETRKLTAGHRAAVNLAGVEKSDLHRGNVLAAPGSMAVTQYAEAKLELLPHAAFRIKTGSRLHLYHGAGETLCRCTLREGSVRLSFEEPIAARVGDRFVVRFFSPAVTIGGGVFTALEQGRRTRRPDVGEVLAEYHSRYPLRDGMPQAELLQKCGTLEGAVIHGTTAALPGFKPRYTPELAKIRDRIEVYYRRRRAQPTENEIADNLFEIEVIRKLLRDGVLIPLGKDLRIHRRYLEQYKRNG